MLSDREAVEEMLSMLSSDDVWCKNVLRHVEGDTVQHCVMGALNHVVLDCYYGVSRFGTSSTDQWKRIVEVMDDVAIEKGYRNPMYPEGCGAHSVEFNNAPETEYEDLRLFLKEVMERVSA